MPNLFKYNIPVQLLHCATACHYIAVHGTVKSELL